MDEDLITDLLRSQGETVRGSSRPDAELIEMAQRLFAGRRFCIVRNWLLLDVMHSDEDCRQLKAQGCEPIVVYASELAYDSGVDAPRMGAIRSSYQSAFKDFWFETKNSVFILAGVGARKWASVPALLALDASD